MRQDDLNKGLYSNINISEEMMEGLIADVNQGKRSGDLRFRYSTAIMALIIVGVVGFGGLGASAAYISYKNRIQEMPAEEQQVYEKELETDVYETRDESMTRAFTKEEYRRYLELEDEYYKNAKFPENILKHVEKLSEISEAELAFVEEINKIHLPEGELTDEQLLQLIDHQAKYDYTIEQNAEAEAAAEEAAGEEADDEATPEEDAYARVSFDLSANDEESIKSQSIALVKEFFGEEIDDSWDCQIFGNDWSELEGFDESWDSYSVSFSESEAPNATFYQLMIPKHEGGIFSINCGGKKYYGDNTEFTRTEAEAYFDEGEKAVRQFMKEMFGLGDADRVEIFGFENEEGGEMTSQDIFYELYYGEDYVSVSWNILNKQVYTVTGRGLLK